MRRDRDGRRWERRAAIASACILLVASSAPLSDRLSAAVSVPLRVVERAGVQRVGEPVTTGIPLPKGDLKNVKNVRLLCDGRPVPAQFRAAGLWRPGDSIKWLLVDFRADVKANGRRNYTLQYGDRVSQGTLPSPGVCIREDKNAYTVATGAATFTISKRTFSLFEMVRLGNAAALIPKPRSSGPARIAPERGAFVRGLRPMVTRAIPDPQNQGRSHLIYVKASDGAALEDYTLRFTSDRQYELAGAKSGALGQGAYQKDFTGSDGVISIPKDAWLPYAYPKQGDVYTFRTVPDGSDFAAEGVFDSAVLERGPLRSVIRLRGSFGPAAAPVLEYTVWYHFYAGSGRVKLAFTLENNDHGGRTPTGNANNANIGGINCVFFDEMVLQLPPVSGTKHQVHLGGAGGRPAVAEPLGKELALYQDSSGGEFWNRYRDPKFHPRPNSYVSFRGYQIERDGTVVDRGERATGWLDISGDGGGLTVGVQDFWQNFPKALAADKDGSIQIGLFPGRYAGDFPFRSGQHKTHEVLFHFHSGSPANDGNMALAAGFSHPLRLEPTPAWFAKTRALGRLHPTDVTNYRDYEVRNFSTIGVLPKGMSAEASLLSRREQHQFFGWMDFGDVSMDFEAPSGQWGMKYDMDYHMAQQYARSLHPWWWRLFVAADKHTGDVDIHHQPHYPGLHFVKGGVWAHSTHNEPGHKNPHRNYNHFTKDLSFGARGTATLHYITGDWKAHDACLEIAENALARYFSPQKDPGEPAQNNRMGWRGDACTLNRLLEGYLLSGEDRYLQRARWQVASCAFDGKPAPLPGGKGHKPTSLWSSVFYMMALARYVEMFPEENVFHREEAKSYLLAHIETLHKASQGPDCMMYTITPQPDGSVTGRGTCSHYNIMAADALTIGYLLSGDRKYLQTARRCFAYGVKHACWKNGPPTYAQVHSANGAMHGNVFMTVDARLRAGKRP